MREFDRAHVWKNGGKFRWSCKQNRWRTFYTFPIFLRKQQLFYVTNEMLVYCFRGELIFFSDKIDLKTVSESFLFAWCKKISLRRQILSTNSHNILHPEKQPSKYVSRRATQKAVSSTVKCWKKGHAWPRKKQSTEQHPLVPYYIQYSPPLIPTIANHCNFLAACIIARARK